MPTPDAPTSQAAKATPSADSPPLDIDPGHLAQIISDFHLAAGYSADYAAGYLDAQRQDGFLRSHAPAWIRKAAAARFRARAESIPAE